MIVVRGIEGFRAHYTRCAATVGKFDGVHLGHQAILQQVLFHARQDHVAAVVILLEPHPEEFFAREPEQIPPRLTTLEEKLALIEAAGIDCVFQLEFNAAVSILPAAQYIREILVAGLGISTLIVGNDFRFGHRRQGDFAMLQEAGQRHGFVVLETASREVDGTRVSSTYVRQQLERADFALVERLLGRPYSIKGEVVRGRQMGTDLGFPTCNIQLHRRRIPLHGVFACEVIWGSRSLFAAVNIGYRPTINAGGDALLEAHILDFDQTLYGQSLEIVFRHKLREEQKFPDLEALKRQIALDVAEVRRFFYH